MRYSAIVISLLASITLMLLTACAAPGAGGTIPTANATQLAAQPAITATATASDSAAVATLPPVITVTPAPPTPGDSTALSPTTAPATSAPPTTAPPTSAPPTSAPPTTPAPAVTPVVIDYPVTACNDLPFRSFLPIPADGVGRTARAASFRDTALPVYAARADTPNPAILGQLDPGERITIIGGPFCYKPALDDPVALAYRQWQISARDGALVGWIEEYDVHGWMVEEDYRVATWQVSPTTVVAGQSVTVTWNFENLSTVTLMTSNGLDRFGASPLLPGNTPMPTSGSATVTTSPYSRYLTIFPIYPEGGVEPLRVEVTCPVAWQVPQTTTANCPTARTPTPMVYQPFERGFMLYLTLNDISRIWVFTSVGASNYSLVDTWNGTALPATATPPAPGLQQPQNGFGYAWLSDSRLQATLGFATGPEQAYTSQLQYTVSGSGVTVYATTLPDGRTIVSREAFSSMLWAEVFE